MSEMWDLPSVMAMFNPSCNLPQVVSLPSGNQDIIVSN